MSNAGNNYLKYYLKLLELKEEEDNLLYQNRKKKFANKINVTELDLEKKESRMFKNFNSKHNLNNNKILNQIQSISKKIYLNSPQDKKNKMLREILFSQYKGDYNIKSNNNIYSNNNDSINNNNINHYNRQNNFFHKVTSPENKNINIRIKKDNEKENNENFSLLQRKSHNEVKTNKSKYFLPPIQQFRYNVKKLKLNINNNVNKSEEEKMMKLYKEYEFLNKNKFVI